MAVVGGRRWSYSGRYAILRNVRCPPLPQEEEEELAGYRTLILIRTYVCDVCDDEAARGPEKRMCR